MTATCPSEGITILVIEPEPRVRGAVVDALDLCGFAVVQADNAQAALTTLKERSDVRVVVTDIDHPSLSDGLAFVREVHHRWPALEQIITSERLRRLQPSDVPGDGVFLPRPLPVHIFLDAVTLAANPGR